MIPSQKFWHGKRVLLTGHTGFKGSWMSLWLQSLGAKLTGFALAPPTDPSLFEAARVAANMESITGDILNFDHLQQVMKSVQPEIVLHLAAQSLVRRSYQTPLETYATNVMGTVNLLEATRHTGSVRAVINVTTDKCYENKEWIWAYRENEPLGGEDPYSNSKACSELVTQAYRHSFFKNSGIALASARAGNVIGGGDFAVDRLIPDILRAFSNQQPLSLRNPQAIRPWQHVLEPISGYLSLAEHLYQEGQTYAEAWNFGPHNEDAKSVAWIAKRMAELWGDQAKWLLDSKKHPHEANCLQLDISKAKTRLGFHPHWSLTTALEHIITWHQAWLNKADVQALCLKQIELYTSTAPEFENNPT